MHPQDAIFTVCHRMPFWKVEAFVRSLRQTNFAGRTVFFCSFIDGSTQRELLKASIEISRFWFLGKHVRQRLAQPWWLWRAIFARPLPQWLRDLLSRRVLHLFYLRHLLYLRFLEKNPGIQRVLMCDCRDLYFQDNPFAGWGGEGLHAFEEYASVPIGRCECHQRWITQLAGASTLQRLSGFPRVCAGTIMADRDSAIVFLKEMVNMICSALSLSQHDGDQGLFNILVHDRRTPNIKVHRNGESSVLTIGDMPDEIITTNRENFVVRSDGSRIPILHQYDRKPDIAEPLWQKIGLQ